MVTIARFVPLLLIGAVPAPASETIIDLHPIVEHGAVTAIDIAMQIAAGSPTLTLTAPIVYPGVQGAADRMTGIVASDANGVVPLTVRDDAAVPGGFPYFRHWLATRSVVYPVRLRYRVAVQPPGGPGGPPFGIRAVGGGVSGSGATLLIVPDDGPVANVSVRWNLRDFSGEAVASTSFGERDFRYTGGSDRLTQGWFLAGPAGRLPMTQGFGATWLGKPTFDARAEMTKAAAAHRYLVGYFPHLKPAAPYRVFLQFREEAPFGGATALDQSFMLSRGPLKPGESAAAPLTTIFHEMIHQWVGQIEAPSGVSSWFSEGLTSYYEAELPLRGGFQSIDQYAARINDYTRQYYASKARNWSAEAITKVGFGDEEVRHTPYRRSELYFHDLDARIRAKSGGRRTLDSVLFPMFVAREQGVRFDTAAWIAMVVRELGPAEKGRFERLILAGTDTIEPRIDAFGPCFRREAETFVQDGQTVSGFRWVRVPGKVSRTC